VSVRRSSCCAFFRMRKLVPEERTKKLREVVAKTGKALAGEGFHVTLTGPWPAYSFIGGAK
jgi:hypothetical protein